MPENLNGQIGADFYIKPTDHDQSPLDSGGDNLEDD